MNIFSTKITINMQKYPNEYYSAHNIFPPKDGEAGVYYVHRLVIHLTRGSVCQKNYYQRRKYYETMLKKLDSHTLLEILPKSNRNVIRGLRNMICFYHTLDH